jgi:hypothetical protein
LGNKASDWDFLRASKFSYSHHFLLRVRIFDLAPLIIHLPFFLPMRVASADIVLILAIRMAAR